jgi:hypothetical protein
MTSEGEFHMTRDMGFLHEPRANKKRWAGRAQLAQEVQPAPFKKTNWTMNTR